jgi:hypothetical protein
MVWIPFFAEAGAYAVLKTMRRVRDAASPIKSGRSQHGGVGDRPSTAHTAGEA